MTADLPDFTSKSQQELWDIVDDIHAALIYRIRAEEELARRARRDAAIDRREDRSDA